MFVLKGIANLATGVISTLLGKNIKNKDAVIQGQQRANEAEIKGAPPSFLRLWRSFLGWVLALVFAWEVVGRTLIQTYWPQLTLPPSMLKEVSHILLGMLGLGI